MKNVLLLFGGQSVEHDISIITALQAMKNLPEGYNFIPIYIDRDNHWWRADNLDQPSVFLNFTQNCKHRCAVTLVAGENRLCEVKHGHFKNSCYVDCALVCCHGGLGEGGGLQGLLELCKIPFTCPPINSSVLCMDKVLSKLQLKNEGIKVVDFVSFDYQNFLQNKDFYLSKIEKEIGYPLIVKPSRLGSSVGVHICASRQEFFTALEISAEYDNKILVEKYLSNCREFACACMQVNGKLFLSNVNEIIKGEFYSFDDKYLSSSKACKVPPKAVQEQVHKLCGRAYQSLGCQGLVRVDFLLGQDKTLYVCEVNTIPGSLSFNLFNFKFSELIASLIEEAMAQNKRQNNLLFNYSSDAIEHYIQICDMNKNAK